MLGASPTDPIEFMLPYADECSVWCWIDAILTLISPIAFAVGLAYVCWKLWCLYRNYPKALKPMTQQDREWLEAISDDRKAIAERDAAEEEQGYYEFGGDRFPLDDI